MANITPQSPALPSIAATSYSCASGGDNVDNPNGNAVIAVTNSHATDPRTVTVGIPSPTPVRPAGAGYPGQELTTIAVVVAAQTTRMIGPIPRAYNDVNGRVGLTYSNSAADLALEAFYWR